MKLNFSLYRYNPDVDTKPYMKEYTLEVDEGSDMMVLDALILLKEQDPASHSVVLVVKVCVVLMV